MPLSGLAGCRARRRTAVLRTGPYRTTRTQGARAAGHHGLPRPSWALAAVLAVFQGGSLSGRGMCAALPPIAGKVACSRARRAIPQGSSRIRRAAESPARAGASGFSPAGGKMPQKLLPYPKTGYGRKQTINSLWLRMIFSVAYRQNQMS